MGQEKKINIITHFPTSPEGQAELARRLGGVHALAAAGCVQRLTCPIEQKQALIQAVLDDSKNDWIDTRI